MKSLVLSILGLSSSCASVAAVGAPQAPAEKPPTSKLGIHLGVRSLDGDDWDLVENQGTIGLEFVHESPESAVGLEIAVFASGDKADNVVIAGNTFDLKARTSEIALGLRKTLAPESSTVHPYMGGGLSVLRAELESESGGSSTSDDDGSAGLYLHGGVDWNLGPNFSLGLDLRLRGGRDVEIFGSERSADYLQLALVLAVAF